MNFEQKTSFSYPSFTSSSSTLSTQISEFHENNESFLKNKDLALSPLNILDEIDESSYSESNSPRCQQFGTNIFYYSSRNDDGFDMSKIVDNSSMNPISIYFEDK